ncbi:MAG TPA: hypothetical protein VLE47_02650 [Candidatus Saccharimonadales bacterium]|nr:hypothetical protein [Candidatus Saccharimonadales bacterium]
MALMVMEGFLRATIISGKTLTRRDQEKIARDYQTTEETIRDLVLKIKRERHEADLSEIEGLEFGVRLEHLFKTMGFDDAQADALVGPSVMSARWRDWTQPGWSGAQVVRVRRVLFFLSKKTKDGRKYLDVFDRLTKNYYDWSQVVKRSEQ